MSRLLKYEDYLLESIISELILESKVVYSNKFMNILKKMKTNKVAIDLLQLYTKDLNVQHNYIDLTDEKDTVSFTPDRKVREILDVEKEPVYRVINEGKYLTHSSGNDRIFEALNYEKPEGEPWAPSEGTLGLILAETISETSGKTYVVFKDLNSDRKTVINKLDGLELDNGLDDSKIWLTSRNNIKVGRLARAILTSSSITVTDREIEEFSNQFKATFDAMSDVFNQFDVVKGNDIAKWYKRGRYVGGDGSLNNSCMAGVDSSYFDIYTKNKQVSLVILYSDDSSDKIKGRAILWDARLKDGTPIMFMDRIYTVAESDIELFKQFAQKNGWWYKTRQSYDLEYRDITNGSETINKRVFCDLDEVDFDEYPYVDTLCFINLENKTASNRNKNADRALRDTGGEWDDPDDY
jgi:hypothetical protein